MSKQQSTEWLLLIIFLGFALLLFLGNLGNQTNIFGRMKLKPRLLVL